MDDSKARWKIKSETVLHDSPWLKLTMADVELPDGTHLQHRVIRYPAPTAGTLLFDSSRDAILLIFRHRFITDKWGWEVPAGLAEPGETPIKAASRETLEETGYLPLDSIPLVEFDTSSGIMDETFHAFFATTWDASDNAGQDNIEAARIEWVDVKSVDQLVSGGQISHGHSLLAILAAFRRGLI